MKKKRKLIPGAELALRISKVLAILMQIASFTLAVLVLFNCTYTDTFAWSRVGDILICIVLYLFWAWVHHLANELLELA